MFSTCKHGCVRRYPKPSGDFRVAIWGYDSRISYPPVNRHSIFCERCRSDLIRCDRMGSHAIACDRMGSHAIANLMSTTVRVLENASGTRSGTESLPKVFLHDNCEQISFIIFFAFLKKEEMRSGTHFTQQNVFLLFTVVVTKHVWPYFQSRFPKTSSERVSSWVLQILKSTRIFSWGEAPKTECNVSTVLCILEVRLCIFT